MTINSMVIGLCLGILAYSALYLGKGLQKLAIEGIKTTTIKSKHSGFWLLGTALSAVFMFMQWAALKYAPINIIAPLDGLGLIVLLLFSFFVLREKTTRLQLLGVFFIVVGTIITSLFNRSNVGLKVTDFSLPRYITFVLIVLILEAIAFTLSVLHNSKGIGIILGLITGTFFALETVSKRITAIPNAKINLIFSIVTMVVSAIGFVISQYALSKTKANIVVPCFTSASITLATLIGVFVLNEKVHLLAISGLGLIVLGVFFLTCPRVTKHTEDKTLRNTSFETV
jgi:drug/metabolite transporter (DMT)-like permease